MIEFIVGWHKKTRRGCRAGAGKSVEQTCNYTRTPGPGHRQQQCAKKLFIRLEVTQAKHRWQLFNSSHG